MEEHLVQVRVKTTIIQSLSKLAEHREAALIGKILQCAKSAALVKTSILEYEKLGDNAEKRLQRDVKGSKLQAILQPYSVLQSGLLELTAAMSALPEDDSVAWLRDLNTGVFTSNLHMPDILDHFQLRLQDYKTSLAAATSKLQQQLGKYIDESWRKETWSETDFAIVAADFERCVGKFKAQQLGENVAAVQQASCSCVLVRWCYTVIGGRVAVLSSRVAAVCLYYLGYPGPQPNPQLHHHRTLHPQCPARSLMRRAMEPRCLRSPLLPLARISRSPWQR